MGKVLTILGAGLLGACLVAAVLAGRVSYFWLVPVTLATSIWRLWRPTSLVADTLVLVFGLSLTCTPILGLNFLARQESQASSRCFDLSRLEKQSQPLPDFRKFQLCGCVYFSAKERVYTRDYGWVQPIYSRRHPRFPGNHGPDEPPSFFLTLEHDQLDRLAHRFLPPTPLEGIRDDVYVRQIRTGFLQVQPGDVLVLSCLARAQAMALCGGALFALGLSLLIANLGAQHRARHHTAYWERPLGP